MDPEYEESLKKFYGSDDPNPIPISTKPVVASRRTSNKEIQAPSRPLSNNSQFVTAGRKSFQKDFQNDFQKTPIPATPANSEQNAFTSIQKIERDLNNFISDKDRFHS